MPKKKQEREKERTDKSPRRTGDDVVFEPNQLTEKDAGKECAARVRGQLHEQFKRQIGDENADESREQSGKQDWIDTAPGKDPINELVAGRRDGLEIISDQIVWEKRGIDEAPHPKDVLTRVILNEIR